MILPKLALFGRVTNVYFEHPTRQGDAWLVQEFPKIFVSFAIIHV